MSLLPLLLLASSAFAGQVGVGAIRLGAGAGTIADLSIGSGKLANGSVDSEKLAKNAVDSEKVVNGSIGNNHLVNLTIDSTKLKAASVDTEKLTEGAVTTGKLNNDAVTSAKIITGAVSTPKLGTDAVDTGKILTDSITTPKLVNSAVETAKLATDSVTSAKIISAAISTAKLATDAVTSSAILGGTITNSKLGLTTRTCAGGNAVTSLSATDDITCAAFGSSSIGGSGTTGTISKWTASSTLGDSIITESGTQVTITGTAKITQSAGKALQITGWSSQNGGQSSGNNGEMMLGTTGAGTYSLISNNYDNTTASERGALDFRNGFPENNRSRFRFTTNVTAVTQATMTFNGDGLLGINNDAPSARIHISEGGTGNATSFQIGTSSVVAKNLAGGVFGFGINTTPTVNFEVAGTAKISLSGDVALDIVGFSKFSGTGSPTTGGALCLNASNRMTKCTSAVDASGNCTCP